jgi:SNF2 family DNA or RNA helicase
MYWKLTDSEGAMADQDAIAYQYLDGATRPRERQEPIDLIQKGDATAFLISLKAGGTELNLTAAVDVIHLDPWWNPAVENQASLETNDLIDLIRSTGES